MNKQENIEELTSLLRLGPLTGLSPQTLEAIKEATIAYEEQELVLDKIRAEIKQLPIYGVKFLNGYFTVHVDVDEVLQIIDKYRGEVDCHSCKTEYECYECKKYEESEEL